ncbi:hypothetical protein VTP01DRAFT_947 [Rhizomucor pusillus]|uniref:uncharacterized protein n=1 Tax=Rhizomucor pusillus TaxID=4840 RepID=UPI0037425409
MNFCPIENNIYNHFISHSGRDHRPCATVPEIFCQRARYCLLLNRISEVNMCSTNCRIDQLMSISAGNTALRHSSEFSDKCKRNILNQLVLRVKLEMAPVQRQTWEMCYTLV